MERQLARAAIAEGRLGFADLYLVSRIDPGMARARRNADASRRRRHFDIHAQLREPLLEWYGAIESVLPGSVIWSLPDTGLPNVSRRPHRPDLASFDILMTAVA
jgi:hypothetical protein